MIGGSMQCFWASSNVYKATRKTRPKRKVREYQEMEAKERKKAVSTCGPALTVILYTFCIFLLLPSQALATAPTIDYSHNMRVLKLPKSTPVGSLIYRLRGSDADPSSQLSFAVVGIEARALLDVFQTPDSWNEADVFLRAPLAQVGHQYNLSVQVSDGNTSTQVESTILVSEDSEHLSPFVNVKHVFRVPENAEPDEVIGQIQVLESRTNELPVRFELRGSGHQKFSIRYVFGPRSQSRAELALAQKLDYEHQNLYTLQVLALNAWTDDRLDTRNVATLDIVISVQDIQDMGPVFKSLPRSIPLATDMQAGHFLAKIEAEDGDQGERRTINYALDAESAAASYFKLNKHSGELTLARPVSEMLLYAPWDSPAWSVLGVFATEQLDATSFERLWPPMVARAELQLMLVDLRNEPPLFIGGWQTPPLSAHSAPVLHGFLHESDQIMANQLVNWYTNYTVNSGNSLVDELVRASGGRPSALDLGLGSNGTFELTLGGADASLFQLEPAFPVAKQSAFWLSISPTLNHSSFNRESFEGGRRVYYVDIIAKDFAIQQRLSSTIHCHIELLDVNDQAPQFESDLFVFSVFENSPAGQLIGQIRAHDSDSGEGSRVRYTSMIGRDTHLFKLDHDTGKITLEGSIDREKQSQYQFLVEARDSSGLGNANHTQLLINVVDVNDNAPSFFQAHYDAVLLADGSFQQPLQVQAIDKDEPGSANSQVAYEIIAGNQNNQFSIDSLTGLIYLTGSVFQAEADLPIQLPPILSETIAPFKGRPEPGGRISQPTGHETEESTESTTYTKTNESQLFEWPRRAGWPRSIAESAAGLEPSAGAQQQVPNGAVDNLLVAETSGQRNLQSRAGVNTLRVAPITTLVVRAHDFGIPVRSNTVKVNIYNQALVSRSVSLILNGTVEQLEPRRELLERAFSSLTGSRATLDSIEALSDSSSISVARLRLAVPQHSLIDLTDLSGLMNALEYRHQQPAAHQSVSHDVHGVAFASSQPSNLTTNQQYTDLQVLALDASTVERRLLIYIIIVAICILALLIIWMVYSCSREERDFRLIGLDKPMNLRPDSGLNQHNSNLSMDSTRAKTAGEPIMNQLMNKMIVGSLIRNDQQHQQQSKLNTLSLASQRSIADHSSMYNGQVWFEPAGGDVGLRKRSDADTARRASSAPSASSLISDSGLVMAPAGLSGAVAAPASATKSPPRDASGKFFPNTRAYAENIASLTAASHTKSALAAHHKSLNGRRHKVAPMKDAADADGSSPSKPPRFNVHAPQGAPLQHNQQPELAALKKQRKGSVGSANNSLGSLSLVEGEMELLGYDHSGTPIVAMHASSAQGDHAIVIDMINGAAGPAAGPLRVRQEGDRAKAEEPAANQAKTGAGSSAAGLEPAQLLPTTTEQPACEPKPEPEPESEPQEAAADATQVVKLPVVGGAGAGPDKERGQAETHSTEAGAGAPEPGQKMSEIDKGSPGKMQQQQGNLMSELSERLNGRSGTKTVGAAKIRSEPASSCSSASSARGATSADYLVDMHNAELLERKSIFAITYGQLMTGKLPPV